jgi:hypothetical protein
MPSRRSPGYEQARARLLASRFVRDDRPRIKVRVDPLVRRSLLTLTVGCVLILAGIALAPPA